MLDLLVPPSAPPQFSDDQIASFRESGYVVVRGLIPPEIVDEMRSLTLRQLADEQGPVEYEAQTRYPGAPESLDAEGGRTIRRLLQAHSRGYVFTAWMTFPPVLNRLQQLLGPEVACPLAHHNCIMAKQPRFSSETGWHQDIRYWSFNRPELVSVWIALGQERVDNGCLQVIPGSHRQKYDRSRFDDALFFRPDLPQNQELLATRQFVELEAGDVLFFHCLTLHAATRNYTDETKYAAVFTFRAGDVFPLPGTRSSASPEILLPRPL